MKSQSLIPVSDHQPLLVRVEEAARMLGVSRSTFYQMLDRGDIPSVRYGTARRVPVSALRAWVERNTSYEG